MTILGCTGGINLLFVLLLPRLIVCTVYVTEEFILEISHFPIENKNSVPEAGAVFVFRQHEWMQPK
jgi:hypothetical protein